MGQDQELINSLIDKKLKAAVSETSSSVTRQELINDLINFKLKSVETNSQVVHPVYQSNTQDQGEQTSPTASDFAADQIHHQLLVLTKLEPFKWNRKRVNADIEAEDNIPRRNVFRSKYTNEEKLHIKDEWYAFMRTNRREIFFFDFVEQHYESEKKLEVITKENWLKEDKTIVSSSHPPQETILISTANTQIPATHFKLPKEDSGVKPVIEQNNFTNQSLHTIGKQLDKIETKIDNLSQPKVTREKPLVNFSESSSKAVALKTTSTSQKIDLMLTELKKERTVQVLNHPEESQTETSLSSSESENDSDSIRKVEQAFQNLEVKRITNRRVNPTSLTKNWYPRPTPL